ncbi:MAG: peptidylprolyl isomerase [Clostridia bacterium]|nr:peptidylprolyl isomerase [Clostridia bacterium]
MKLKRIIIGVLSLALLFAMGCAAKETEKEKTDMENNNQHPIATITMEDGETIVLELYPEVAPISVANFISLANSGFYDGVIFHRVIPGFMIQGGDPDGRGTGGPGYTIKGEFTNNHVQNDISHERGVISMARQGNPYFPEMAYNTAGSQFFIMHEDGPFLDGDYAAFGRVIQGMDTVDRIASCGTDGNDRPLEDQKMATVRVETFGVDYGEPEKIVR